MGYDGKMPVIIHGIKVCVSDSFILLVHSNLFTLICGWQVDRYVNFCTKTLN